MKDELAELRNKIDYIDKKTLELLKQRLAVVRKVGEYKRANNLANYDPKRKKIMIKSRMELAEKLGISKKAVKKIYEAIHDMSLKLEEELK